MIKRNSVKWRGLLTIWLIAALWFTFRATWGSGATSKGEVILKPAVVNGNSFRGKIDQQFLNFLEDREDGSTINLESGGGIAHFALEASERIQEKNISVTITVECSSACVDFLIPAFRSVKIQSNAVFAIHGNSVTLDREVSTRFPNRVQSEDYASCHRAALWLQEIWTRKNVQWKLLNQLTNSLGARHVIAKPKSCGKVIYELDFYVLDRSELNAIFGDKFDGSTCGDSLKCINDIRRTRFASSSIKSKLGVFPLNTKNPPTRP
jgi:hypothetical protein